MYIITEGVALHKMFTIIGIGDSWGSEDVLLAEPPPPKRETKAMTYLRVISIGRTEFRSLEAEFPEPFSQMKAVAVWKKARRIIKMAFEQEKRRAKEEEAEAARLSQLSLSVDDGGDDRDAAKPYEAFFNGSKADEQEGVDARGCLLYTSPSPRD